MTTHLSISTGCSAKQPRPTKVAFPAGNQDFRDVRNRCSRACRDFNNTPEDEAPDIRSQKWLDIVKPNRDRSQDAAAAVTHDQTFGNAALKAVTPFVKPPVHIDYGVRLKVGGSTFINRGCMIMDTPVADVVIGEGCNIGPNCCIISVTHPTGLGGRKAKKSLGKPVTIGNDVWIGANVTILPGATIGDGAVIGACSMVSGDIPPMTLAYGSPATVRRHLTHAETEEDKEDVAVENLAQAMAFENQLAFRSRSSEIIDDDILKMNMDLVLAPQFSSIAPVASPHPPHSLPVPSRGGEHGSSAALRSRLKSSDLVMITASTTFLLAMFLSVFFGGWYLGETRACLLTRHVGLKADI